MGLVCFPAHVLYVLLLGVFTCLTYLRAWHALCARVLALLSAQVLMCLACLACLRAHVFVCSEGHYVPR